MLPTVAAGSIPSPLPPWSKWAIALGATPSSYLVQFLTYLGTMNDATSPSPGEWRHLQLVFSDNVTNDPADEMIVTLDLANITGGGLDSSWTTQDYTTTDLHVGNLMISWAAHMDSGVTAKEIRYYRRSYNPYSNQQPFTLGGPPDHVHPVNYQGTQTGPIPHQIAVTHTEITTFPRHWGRAYWPAIAYAGSTFAAGGKLANTAVDAICTGIQDNYQLLQNAEFFPCVPTTQALGVASRQLLGITAIQVDNVLDVVRRRRAAATTYRKQIPITP